MMPFIQYKNFEKLQFSKAKWIEKSNEGFKYIWRSLEGQRNSYRGNGSRAEEDTEVTYQEGKKGRGIN